MTQQPLGTLKNRASAIERWAPGSQRATEAREEYQRARLEQRIRELVESSPPLTETQLERLAVLLRPAVKATAAQRATRGAA